MSALLAIASNTFREAIRDRVLYLILFFSVVVILGSEAVAVLAVGAADKVAVDLGLAAISLSGVLVSVFLGLSLVSKEIERRTVYTVVSKPVSRGAFVLGKLAGLYATVVLLVAAMAVVFLVFVELRHQAATVDLVVCIAMSLVEDLVVASLAVLFSCFTTPILGTLFTLTLYVVGHLSEGLKMLARFEHVRDTAWAKVLIALYHVLPNLERFNIRGAAAYGDPIPASYLLAAAGYGACYSAAVLALALAVFSRRDFT